MIPKYPELKPIGPEDVSEIRAALGLSVRNICELALANLFIWRGSDKPRLTLINDNVCVLISPLNEPPYFLEPLSGNKSIETVDICLKHAGKISRASEDFVHILKENAFKITPLRNQFDYVYLTKDLAELKGKAFDGKRNHIKRFTKRFPDHKFAPIDQSFREEALALFEKWCRSKNGSAACDEVSYRSQRSALEAAFEGFKELKLLAHAIFAEGSMKGFVIGSALNEDTACAHFQYVDPDAEGVSQTLLMEAAKNTFSAFECLNLEQDLGIAGLRKTKLSYHPLKLEKKFEVELKEAG